MSRVVLHSPLAPVEVAHRLKAAVGETMTASSPRCVTGHGTEAKLTLWVHRPKLRNDFKTLFVATLAPDRGGTRIEGRMGPARSVTGFMIVWMGFVGTFLLFGIGMIAVTGVRGGAGLAFVLIPFGMIALAVLILLVSRHFGRGDAREMLDFLRRIIDARPRGDAGVAR